MGRMLRNPEYKAIVVRISILFAAMAVLMCGMAAVLVDELQAKAVDQSAAVVGRALAAHPELEQAIVGAVIVPASAEDIDRGRAVLMRHGYDAATPVGIDPVLGGAYPTVFIAALAVTLVCAIAVLALVTLGYRRIYRTVGLFSVAAERAVDGDYGSPLPAGGEGEFHILGHRFNQMVSRLRQNVEQLVAEKVFLKDTISDISHQLKTPLSSLIIYNDLLLENETMDATERREFLALGRQQLQRLEWLIQSLLKMARLEAGSVRFRREKVNLREVVAQAAATLRMMAEEAEVTVTIREQHPDSGFTGDAAWLQEAVINVLKNGIEHSGPGGTIEITVDQTPLTATITVTDHGEGITPEDLPHIFERFYRSASTVKPNSIGIGLSMSKAIVEGQGGSIAVKSTKGRGSEFTLTFLKTLNEQ